MNELQALYKVKESNLPFVIFSDFGTNKINIIVQENNTLNFLDDFENEKGFVFAPFEKKLKKVLIKEHISFSLNIEKNLKPKLISINNFFEKKKNDLTNSKKLYEDKFNLAKENISKQILEKVIISRKESVILKDDFDLITTYISLVLKNINSYNYLFFHPKIGIWMGSSPELFLSQKKSLLKTYSLAGTKSLSEKWTPKEKKEQTLVSNYILDIFKKNELKPQISELETFSYSNIEHLRNIITADLKENSDINKLIDELHPTPAVCGFPKKEAYNFILTKEGYDREFYTGFLGYTSKYEKELYVNLRCMKFDIDKSYLYLGGGIIEDSILEKEWIETERKSELLKSILE